MYGENIVCNACTWQVRAHIMLSILYIVYRKPLYWATSQVHHWDDKFWILLKKLRNIIEVLDIKTLIAVLVSMLLKLASFPSNLSSHSHTLDVTTSYKPRIYQLSPDVKNSRRVVKFTCNYTCFDTDVTVVAECQYLYHTSHRISRGFMKTLSSSVCLILKRFFQFYEARALNISLYCLCLRLSIRHFVD